MVKFDPSKFTAPAPKVLPVFLLLDLSSSMSEILDSENIIRTGQYFHDDGQDWELVEGGISKINVLNEAVKTMIDSFAEEERLETEFLISIITFASEAKVHQQPSSASAINWQAMETSGYTSMGAAFSLCKKLIEDKNVVSSRAYRPTIVLVSDGEPTDSWETPLNSLIKDGRSSKCFFMAMGIGESPGNEVLKRFISQTPVLAEVNGNKIANTVFQAQDADQIRDFFQKVTMSVTVRSKSQNPNSFPQSNNDDNANDGVYW